MQNTNKVTLDNELDHILKALNDLSPESKEYSTAVENLETLTRAKNSVNEHRVTPDTIVLAVTNILGILLILNYERLNVISTKTLGLILKGRL